MNSYEAKIEAKRERYTELAEKAEHRSEQASKAAHGILDNIPMGQPILVGHHSEGRHRIALKRADNAMRRTCEEQDKAKYYENKAASVGTGGISSDDPEAVKKLKENIEQAEKLQSTMREANKIIHKSPKNIETPEKVIALIALGMKESSAKTLFTPDFCGRIGFPDYSMTNNNANIRRMKLRVEQLEKLATKAEQGNQTIEFSGGKIIINYEENRLQVFHDVKPSEEIRNNLKHGGFRWSRFNGCWQRFISTNALWNAKRIVGLEVA